MSVTRRKFLKTALITVIAAGFSRFGFFKENRLKNIKRPQDIKNLKKAKFYKKIQ